MTGYDGFSKSNNAIAAEENGLYPASVLARRLKVKTAAVRALLAPEEWHHTSKRYNRTDYYSIETAADMLADLRGWTPKPTDCGWFRPVIGPSGRESSFCNYCTVERATHS